MYARLQERHGRRLRAAAPLMLLLALAALTGAAAADEWPTLRHGMWEFERSIDAAAGGKAQKVQAKECVNPTENMKRQNETLAKSGCKFSPVTRSGNVHTYSAVCKMQGLSGTSKSVLTVENDSAYTIRIESDFGGETTKELLRARRIGDCPR